MITAARVRSTGEYAVAVGAVLVLWEVMGRTGLIGNGAMPPLTAIASAFAADFHAYPAHALATLHSAALGFVWGNLIALVVAAAFVLLPITEKLTRGVLITLFCVPIVVLAPILGIAFSGDAPKVILAALSVIYTTVVATVVSMRSIPPGIRDVVVSSGGGRIRLFLFVELRAGLPGILAGFQIAALAAVLGAILGEFLGGQHGIGVFLVGAMTSGSPARLWAVALLAAALCSVAYGVFGLLRQLVTRSSGDIAVTEMALAPARASRRAAVEGALVGLVGVTLTLGAWWYFVWWTALPPTVAKSPLDVWQFLTSGPASADAVGRLGEAFAQSLPPATLGVVLGLAFALGLAVATALAPRISAVFVPLTFFSQTLPLVAFAPLIALVMGRGTLTILAVTIAVTFFPAFVTIAQGMAQAPAAPAEVLHSVAADQLTVMRIYTIPQAMPHLLAAARLAVPRALLGVIVAEQLVTGTGLGGLLSRSRGFLDYSMMWSIAAVSVAVSLLAFLAVSTLEDRMLRRWWA